MALRIDSLTTPGARPSRRSPPVIARPACVVIASNRLLQTWEPAGLYSASARLTCSAVRAFLSKTRRSVTTKTPWMRFSSAGEDDSHTWRNALRVSVVPYSMIAVASASLELKWW